MDYRLALGVALFLTACSGNPMADAGSGDGGGGGGAPVENPVPENLAGDVSNITFDAATDTLKVRMNSLDDAPQTVEYRRNPALDVPGYRGFSVQDDPLDRMFVAMTAESADGSVEAAAISDGGQFNRYYSGTYFRRNSGNVPTTGQVSYAGTYAGVTNLNASGENLLPVPPGTDPALIPDEPMRTQGKVFLNVNFDDAAVNGVVTDRRLVGGGSLKDVALVDGVIDENGQFTGEAEFDGRPDDGDQGDFGGVFGGRDGAAVAGTVVLDNIFLSDDPRNSEFDAEVGVFVLPRCNQPGAPAICDQVNP